MAKEKSSRQKENNKRWKLGTPERKKEQSNQKYR